jgi:hypothetical protein
MGSRFIPTRAGGNISSSLSASTATTLAKAFNCCREGGGLKRNFSHPSSEIAPPTPAALAKPVVVKSFARRKRPKKLLRLSPGYDST